MSKRLFKTMVAVLAIAAAAAGPARAQSAQSETIITTSTSGQNIITGTHFIISSGYIDGDGMQATYGGITVTPVNTEYITKVVVTCGYRPEKVSDANISVSSGTKTITNGGGTITVTNVNATTFTFTCSDPAPQFSQFEVFYLDAPPQPQMYTSAVAMSALQVGDTLAEGFSLSGNDADYIYLVANRHKHNENLSGYLENISLDQVQSIGANCVFSTLVNEQSITFAPVDGNGQDCDAWVVTAVESDAGFTNITIAGITIPVPHTVTFAEGTEDVGNWSFTPAEAATNTGVTAGTVVTVKYNGTRRINSIEAMVDGPSLTTPLTIEALTAGTILVNMDANLSTGMKYSVNGGEKTTINNTTTIPVNAGDKVQFYGNGTSTTEYGNFPEVKLQGTAETKVYGNIMSLLDETGYETATTLSGEFVFYGLFSFNANLKDASGLLLPAMTLANSCYSNMFHDCTGLTEAPVLPAPTLVNGCYYSMFYDCNNLSSVTCLATSGIDQYSSTSYWLEDAGSNVTGTKTFNAVSTAEWPTSVSGIPEGWTRQAIGAQSTPEPVTLVPTGNTNEWTLTMPADNMLLMVNYATAPVPITVRMAEGTEDAANWSIASGNASVPGNQVLENVMSGSQVTATYNGTTKKVKSVKAVKYVAPAATVTSEPTATGAIIEVGSTAALVNAGAASGGSMMYAVTATNVQPASTADFSASVPTAEGRTAGTYYVWYYVEGDASHTDSEIAGPVSVTLAAITTVTWNSTNVFNSDNWMAEIGAWQPGSLTYEGITISKPGDGLSTFYPYDLSAEAGHLTCRGNENDPFTFTAPDGKKFCKIEIIDNVGISFDEYGDWTEDVVNHKIVWSGTAASTVTLGTVFTAANYLNSIVFKLIDAQ